MSRQMTDEEWEEKFKAMPPAISYAPGILDAKPTVPPGGRRIVTDGSAPADHPMFDHARPRKPASVTITRVSDVEAEAIEWLWPQRFAVGKLGLISGWPGLGKSNLTAFMAAAVTTGMEWPNGEGRAPLGDVVMLAAEDDIADTIRPRLEAAGADIGRVHVIKSVTDEIGKRRGFNLQADLALLDTVLTQAAGSIKLVTLDPITAYLGGKVDSHKAADVMGVLAPVAELAARHGVAIVAVTHPPKSGGGKGVNASVGSQAFVAVVRTSWLVAEDPDDTERRLLLSMKNNIGHAKGLAFKIYSHPVPTKQGTVYAPRVVFVEGDIETTADDVVKSETTGLGRNKGDKAKAFLAAALKDGPVAITKLIADAKEQGISYDALKRVRDGLGIVSNKDSMKGGWVWGYPKESEYAKFFPLGGAT